MFDSPPGFVWKGFRSGICVGKLFQLINFKNDFMKKLNNLMLSLGVATLFAVVGCKEQSQTKSETTPQVSTVAASDSGVMSYQEFKSRAFQEKDTGVFIVNGDEMVSNEKKLKEYYERFVAQEVARKQGKDFSVVHQSGGKDVVWSNYKKWELSYCISDSFGNNKAAVVAAIETAAKSWQESADVLFRYKSEHDANCDANNLSVLFDVSPATSGSYLARAFFPDDVRADRNVLINNSAFTSTYPTLTGLMRHELGHTLGLRHEHTRPESGACFEDNDWRALTPYDRLSVMHYPHCNGVANNPLELTDYDRQGVAALYNHPYDTPDNDSYATFAAEASTDAGEWFHYKLKVRKHSTIKATTVGTGDADLYVRLGSQEPTTSTYDCRPYTGNSKEECDINTGTNDYAYVSVRGYRAASYKLVVKFPSVTTTSAEIVVSGGLTGQDDWHHFWAAADPNTTVTADTDVTENDVDLFIRKDKQPGRYSYDCDSTKGATVSESCSVDSGTSQLVYVSNQGYISNVIGKFLTTIKWNHAQ